MNFKHGFARDGEITPEYAAWCAMKTRCSNQNEVGWSSYGGRGIRVCRRWINSFPNFIADMGLRPSPQHSLERKNNSRGYSPKNCIWASKKEQARNRRSSRIVVFMGRKMSLAEACEIAGVDYGAAKYRLNAGKPFNMAIRSNAKDFHG